MAWRRPGDKPLSEPMLTQFTDAYMRHKGVGVGGVGEGGVNTSNFALLVLCEVSWFPPQKSSKSESVSL